MNHKITLLSKLINLKIDEVDGLFEEICRSVDHRSCNCISNYAATQSLTFTKLEPKTQLEANNYHIMITGGY